MESLLAGLRAAGEQTRLRILAILARSELTVTELTRVLGQSQPRVSRHLKLLCEAGLLDRSQEGAWAFYRLADSGDGAHLARALLELLPAADTATSADMSRLKQIRAEHAEAAARYFSDNARQWDFIRGLYSEDARVEEAMLAAAANGPLQQMLDLGTGTGHILKLFSARARSALGIDSSHEMLKVARANLESANLHHCQVRLGDIYRLNLEPASVDLVTIHHVLHFLDDPALAVREAARILRPGGLLLIVDFAPHKLEILHREHAHRRLGFETREVKFWCAEAGLEHLKVQEFKAAGQVDGVPLSVCLWSAQQPRAAMEHAA